MIYDGITVACDMEPYIVTETWCRTYPWLTVPSYVKTTHPLCGGCACLCHTECARGAHHYTRQFGVWLCRHCGTVRAS